MKKNRKRLANGSKVEIRYFDMDKRCDKCNYTIFGAGKRYVEIDGDDEERHYHDGCYKPLYAGIGNGNEKEVGTA